MAYRWARTGGGSDDLVDGVHHEVVKQWDVTGQRCCEAVVRSIGASAVGPVEKGVNGLSMSGNGSSTEISNIRV
jgi:hypothetical protein